MPTTEQLRKEQMYPIKLTKQWLKYGFIPILWMMLMQWASRHWEEQAWGGYLVFTTILIYIVMLLVIIKDMKTKRFIYIKEDELILNTAVIPAHEIRKVRFTPYSIDIIINNQGKRSERSFEFKSDAVMNRRNLNIWLHEHGIEVANV